MNLVTAAELAQVLKAKRSHVYENQEFYGAVRLGNGPKAPLRFDLDAVLERISCHTARESEQARSRVAEPIRLRRRTCRLGTGVELLPIRGRSKG